MAEIRVDFDEVRKNSDAEREFRFARWKSQERNDLETLQLRLLSNIRIQQSIEATRKIVKE